MVTEPENFATIDELLRAEEEPTPAPRLVRSGWTWLVTSIVVSLVLAGIGYVMLRALEVGVPFGLVFSVVFAISLLRRALAAVRPPPLPKAATGQITALAAEQRAIEAEQMQQAYLAMTRWDTRLEWTERDPERFALVVRGRLADLADERLRLRHGITRAAHPAAARQMMGEELWEFLHLPIRRTPTPRELAEVVGHVEAI
jgi:hypothetical protein